MEDCDLKLRSPDNHKIKRWDWCVPAVVTHKHTSTHLLTQTHTYTRTLGDMTVQTVLKRN